MGLSEHASGFGDMVARVKYRLTADDAPVAVAIDPFVGFPTANRRLGNRKGAGGADGSGQCSPGQEAP